MQMSIAALGLDESSTPPPPCPCTRSADSGNGSNPQQTRSGPDGLEDASAVATDNVDMIKLLASRSRLRPVLRHVPSAWTYFSYLSDISEPTAPYLADNFISVIVLRFSSFDACRNHLPARC